ncbi:MAG: guanine deaminase [Armatimonadaceae bacterium]
MTSPSLPDPQIEHQTFLREAVRLSIENVQGGHGGPFGAVVVRDGAVVGYGANSVTATNDPTAHAEIVAIRRAGTKLATFDLAGCVLYTSCEPCPMCLAAAYWARLDAIFYAATQHDAAAAGFDDAFLYREVSLPVGERSLPITLLPELEELAKSAFALWHTSPHKAPY